MDPELEALQAELAALEGEVNQPTVVPITKEPAGYSLGQLAFDIPAGLSRGGAGLVDVLSYPAVKGLQYLGAPVEPLGWSALVGAGAEAAASKFGVRPETAVQNFVSFLSPSPLSKAKVISQAGTGLAAYLGSEAGQAIAPESPYAGLVGALAGPTVASTTAALAKAAASKIAPTVGIIAGSETALKNAAQAEILANAGEEGIAKLKLAQSLKGMSEGAGGVPLTAAEIAQSPSLAKYQQVIRQTQEGGNILTPAIETRQNELAAALGQFGVKPQQGDFAVALRDAAETAATQKAAREVSLLETLGLTEEIKAATPTERSKTIRDAIFQRKDAADQLAEEAWRAVPKETKVDISSSLKSTLDEYDKFGELSKADIGDKAKRVIAKTERLLSESNGITTVADLQDLRSAAGRAMAEASGTNPRQASLMATLRENIDTAGIKYFYDQGVGSPGGLPGTAATATDLNALEKLSTAIQKTRESKQLFSEGVVGQITAIKQFKPKLATTRVIDLAIKTPENASEILQKFGKDSVEMTTARGEMLSRLDAAKNPTEFVGKNKEVLQTLFGGDYDVITKFAKSKGQSPKLSELAKVTETTIPNKIFADTTQANKFANAFKDTEIFQFARSKFISERLTKSGDPLANLDKNKNIAQIYFPKDLEDLRNVLKDIDISKSPQKLAAAATKGQSWTSQMQTTLGAIMSTRGVLGAMKKGTGTGALIGFGAGPLGSAAGAVGGYIMSRIGNTRESQLNELAAQFLANPSLLKFAKAPPTQQNIKTLLDRAAEMGYLASKTIKNEPVEMATPASEVIGLDTEADPELADLQAELQSLQEMVSPTKPTESVKVGKQNISLPTGDKYAPASLVKAVMQVESSGKQGAVSPKGATGLMQLMPGTARDLGVDATDAQQNVEGGSRYLRQMLDKYGDQKLALAAYNWGPGNVDRAIKKLRAEGLKISYENVAKVVKIPSETRNYVNRVIQLA